MFQKQVMDKVKAKVKKWTERVAERADKKKMEVRTAGGIPLKPLYSPADMEGIDFDDISIPGEYPYTRGFRHVPYSLDGWMMRQPVALGLSKDTRARMEYLERIGWGLFIGQEGENKLFVQNIALDTPSQQGYDPDSLEARGRVGRDGTSLSTMWDYEDLYEGRDLTRTEVFFATPDGQLPCLACYLAYAEKRGIPWEKLRLKVSNLWYHSWYWDCSGYPPGHAYKLGPECVEFFLKHVPMAQVASVTGYNPGETGATPTQEIAFTLATAIFITEECIKAGLDPDEFVPRYYGHDHTSLDLFETVAKFRAKRKMWAKIFKEKFGCKNPEALRLRNFPQTGGSFLHRNEPENNIIRVTIMALAQVLAGADGVWAASYDECLNIPSQKAAQIALRTGQIIYYETNMANVMDPLGGSYYVECLTKKIEEEAYRLLEEIEKKGGYLKCWESGWFRSELAREARKWQESIDSGERTIVGVNKYKIDEEDKSPLFRVGQETEEEAIKRVKAFKEQRDNDKAEAALDNLRNAIESMKNNWPRSCGRVMPAMVDAFRADCTIGETQGLLKEVLGYGYYGHG
ncbi:MAG: methylmalonyl-CoA mutase [Deltaproteobacteria bacterium]|nr:methylmalonyl-CoA mutase [Deltaproteobacteria bacterium]